MAYANLSMSSQILVISDTVTLFVLDRSVAPEHCSNHNNLVPVSYKTWNCCITQNDQINPCIQRHMMHSCKCHHVMGGTGEPSRYLYESNQYINLSIKKSLRVRCKALVRRSAKFVVVSSQAILTVSAATASLTRW